MQRALAGIALLGLLAACGGPERTQRAGGRPSVAAASGTPSAGGTASPAGSNPRTSGAATASPTTAASAARRPAGYTATESNWVKASVLDDESWGPGCGVSPHRGKACQIPFDGLANLQSSDAGQIALEAYEDGASLPAAVRLIAAKKGLNRFCTDASCAVNDARLVYTASASAKTVTFFVVLRATDGRLLASSYPISFRVL